MHWNNFICAKVYDRTTRLNYPQSQKKTDRSPTQPNYRWHLIWQKCKEVSDTNLDHSSFPASLACTPWNRSVRTCNDQSGHHVVYRGWSNPGRSSPCHRSLGTGNWAPCDCSCWWSCSSLDWPVGGAARPAGRSFPVDCLETIKHCQIEMVGLLY